MTAKVIYTGDLRTEATHLRSGTVIETDAPVDNKGKGERFSPTDLVATALATCILTTMGISGANHSINIDGTVCEVEKVMASDPRRIAEIKVFLSFPAGKTYTDKEKTILERIAHTCPVAVSLHPDLKQTISISWG
ncbi:MAG: OsmC family protein [Bacteroidetes bacterium]|nr:OsmC family protein [Bacteroidota bacterium]